MKKYYVYLVFALMPIIAIGQKSERQTGEGSLMNSDSIKTLIPEVRQKLLKDVDVIFNTRMGYDSYFSDSNHDISHFTVNQFRFEMKGKIHDKVSFRFRNRYTREPVPGNLDNVSRSVDLAFLKIDVTPKTQFTFGKLCADWGGYEFDFNPIDIMAYNDIIEYADNFLVGAGISHSINDNHSLSLQVLNSRTKTFEEQYGATAPPSINPSEYPLAAVVNWRGKFFGGKFETTWSYSLFNEAEGAHMDYFALGNKFKAKNFVLYYDFQYSNEGLDRKGIVSNIIQKNPLYTYAAQDVLYVENWVRAEYLVAPKVTLLLSVFNSNHSWKGNPDPNGSSKLSTSYGFIPTIEYMPFKDMNMRFFIGYIARKYDYTNYAQTTFGVKDYTTGQLSVGIVAPLLVL